MIKFMQKKWPLFLALDVILIPLVILWYLNLDKVAAFLSRYWNWL